MAETNLLHNELTHEIIGSAMEVHKILGFGFLENVYEEALAIELNLRKIPYKRQKGINILYKGLFAKQFICDLLVGNKVLVELKALKNISNIEEAQILNYMKATGIEVGLLINFGEQSLKYKRFILQQKN
ncbi:MAG: hypothetical protein BWY69_01013 [Planctomycetes bacterium ADurb.Bin401]|nr:MAG: hypothetical protein BWY69_01013 [Planctomycetes bacterium ADurb.Bin401]